MNALQIAQNENFVIIAMAEAFELLSEKTGITVKSLQEQFPVNEKLQKSVAELVAKAAQVTAEELNDFE